jgi:hypothetical protein
MYNLRNVYRDDEWNHHFDFIGDEKTPPQRGRPQGVQTIFISTDRAALTLGENVQLFENDYVTGYITAEGNCAANFLVALTHDHHAYFRKWDGEQYIDYGTGDVTGIQLIGNTYTTEV